MRSSARLVREESVVTSTATRRKTVADENQPPVITGYDVQGSASTSGGETVTVAGSNLSAVTSMSIGPYPAGFVIDSDTQLRFTAPAYDPGITGDPATAKVSAGHNSLMSDDSQFSEWTWGGQTRAELQAAAQNAATN
jgi:hypothetical protein